MPLPKVNSNKINYNYETIKYYYPAHHVYKHG